MLCRDWSNGGLRFESLRRQARTNPVIMLKWPVCLGVLRRKLRRLVFRNERVDDFAERLALEDLRQLVKRQIDAVFGDAPLRVIVGADAFGPVAGADLAAPLGGARRVLLLAFE